MPESSWLIEVAKQVPAAAAVVYVVAVFLAHMERIASREEKAAERREAILSAALKESTEAMGRFDALQEKLEEFVARGSDHQMPTREPQPNPPRRPRPPS